MSAKRQKKGTDKRSKASGSSLSSSEKSRTDATNTVKVTKDNGVVANGKNTEALDFGALHTADEHDSNASDNREPRGAGNNVNSVNDDMLQELDSMETSSSQRPMLSRFQRFSQRKRNGFISARVTRTSVVS